jgi:pyruvate formate lyase activating enzyme
MKFLKRCKAHGIHTAMETCGYAKFETFNSLVPYLDLLLYDIKHMDSKRHAEATGVPNELILDNFRKLSAISGLECVIRIPLIPDFNDDAENIKRTADFVAKLKIKKLDLLPFNYLPSGKYKTLGIDWEYKNTKKQDEESLKTLKNIVEGFGLTTTIGGLW